jgi:TPR repeat protein
MQRGMTSYEAGDYGDALAQWRPLADAGDPAAQFLLGLIHEQGQGVPVDAEAAARWYRRAADQGHPAAQNNLGLLHWMGRGVPRSRELAAQWYAKSAAQGFAPARNNLGVLHLIGDPMPRDVKRAHELLRMAAQEGDPIACELMATLFDEHYPPQSRAATLTAAR